MQTLATCMRVRARVSAERVLVATSKSEECFGGGRRIGRTVKACRSVNATEHCRAANEFKIASYSSQI